jgi:transcriptional regulator with XRE-family HTH domain
MPRQLKPLNPYASWTALFGATVQRLRLSLRSRPRVSQEELGRRIGYDGSTVGAIERGVLRPDAKFIEGCERELPAHGWLWAMLPAVNAEWDDWDVSVERHQRLALSHPPRLLKARAAPGRKLLGRQRRRDCQAPHAGSIGHTTSARPRNA